jgi:hypothetical protein
MFLVSAMEISNVSFAHVCWPAFLACPEGGANIYIYTIPKHFLVCSTGGNAIVAFLENKITGLFFRIKVNPKNPSFVNKPGRIYKREKSSRSHIYQPKGSAISFCSHFSKIRPGESKHT